MRAVLKDLRNLLEEREPFKDIRTNAEPLAAHRRQSQDPAVLTGHVRCALGRMIYQQINGLRDRLPVITLDPALEHILQNSLQSGDEAGPVLEPGLAERMHQAIQIAAQKHDLNGEPSVLLVSAALRHMLARFLRRTIPNLHVLAYNELPDNKQIKVVASIGNK